jgi:hypothetical protein
MRIDKSQVVRLAALRESQSRGRRRSRPIPWDATVSKGGTPTFALPTYSRAASAFLFDAIQAMMRAKDPVLDSLSYQQVDVLPHNRVTLESGEVLESPSIPMLATFTLSVPDMIAGRFDSLYEGIDSAADQGLSVLMPAFFQHISDITDATGQVVHAGDRPLFDVIIETLQGMDVGFDEHDQPTTSVVMHPQLAEKISAQGGPSPEQLARLQEVIDRKRVEYHRRRDSRRLS